MARLLQHVRRVSDGDFAPERRGKGYLIKKPTAALRVRPAPLQADVARRSVEPRRDRLDRRRRCDGRSPSASTAGWPTTASGCPSTRALASGGRRRVGAQSLPGRVAEAQRSGARRARRRRRPARFVRSGFTGRQPIAHQVVWGGDQTHRLRRRRRPAVGAADHARPRRRRDALLRQRHRRLHHDDQPSAVDEGAVLPLDRCSARCRRSCARTTARTR